MQLDEDIHIALLSVMENQKTQLELQNWKQLKVHQYWIS